MLPFINFCGLEIPSYGLMIIAGIFEAFLIVYLRRKEIEITVIEIILISSIAAAAGLLGSKLFYLLGSYKRIVAAYKQAGEQSAFFANLIRSGFVFYGGLLATLPATILSCRKFDISLNAYLKAMLPEFPLAHAFGRLGCFLAGCCYGIESPEHGICFINSLAGPRDIAYLPVQLYEAAGCFLIFLILFRRRNKQSGIGLLMLYLWLYTPFRFVLEFFRGDEARGIFGPFSTSQWLSILIMAALTGFQLKRKKTQTF